MWWTRGRNDWPLSRPFGVDFGWVMDLSGCDEQVSFGREVPIMKTTTRIIPLFALAVCWGLTGQAQVYFSLSRIVDTPVWEDQTGEAAEVGPEWIPGNFRIHHGVVAYTRGTPPRSLVLHIAGENWEVVGTNTVLPGGSNVAALVNGFDLRGLDVVFEAGTAQPNSQRLYKRINGVTSLASASLPAGTYYNVPRFNGNDIYCVFQELFSSRRDIYRIRNNSAFSLFNAIGFNISLRDVRTRKGVVMFLNESSLYQVFGDQVGVIGTGFDPLDDDSFALVDGGYVYSGGPQLRINSGGNHGAVSGSPSTPWITPSGRNIIHSGTLPSKTMLDDSEFSPTFQVGYNGGRYYPYFDSTLILEWLFSFTKNRQVAKGELVLHRRGENHLMVLVPTGEVLRERYRDSSDRSFIFVRNENGQPVILRATELGWEPIPLARDFDGDGLADPGVYEIASGYWLQRRTAGRPLLQPYGYAGAMPASGDFDGDLRADLSVFDPVTAIWYAHASSNKVEIPVLFTPGGTLVPCVGDFDGDGRDDRAVFQREAARWEITTAAGQTSRFVYGFFPVQPVPADYDNDGKDDVAVYHAPTGKWYIKGSAGVNLEYAYGYEGTVAVPGNYVAGGGDEMAVYDPANGKWYIRNSQGGTTSFILGPPGAIPRAADFDGDGLDDPASYDPYHQKWHVMMSTDGLQVL
jgi:hypothetical protein